MLLDIIAGARPNFMKIAPIIEAIKKSPIRRGRHSLPFDPYWTHYDKNMWDGKTAERIVEIIFDELTH